MHSLPSSSNGLECSSSPAGSTVEFFDGSGLHVPPLESYFCKMVDFIKMKN
jgi:hypothetical protein